MEQKPHIAILPSPGMGHLIPLVEFAKLLVHHHDFNITCIIPVLGSPPKAMKAVLQALPTTIDHVFLPPVILEEEEIRGLKFEVQTILTLTRSLPPLRDVLKSTQFSAFVVDPFGIDALDIAKELNISPYIFFHTNALTLSLVFHLPKLDDTVSCQYRDLPEPLKLPGCIPIHGRDLMEPVQDRTSELYKMILHSAKQFRLAEGIIINTFVELEGSAIKALLDEEAKSLPLYPIGPIQSGSSNQFDKSESDCLRWLDNQPHGSVLFVCFGSGGTLSYDQTNELALGLELSGQKFLWVVRTPNNESADATYLSDQTLDNNTLSFLPKGFVERTKWQGLVVPSWASQAQVLSHGSTGGFLSHCGWNSILESIMQCIPLIAWPLYAEQKMNAVLLAEDVKVALRPKTNKNGLIDREEIAKVVKGLMVGEEGKKVRNRMKDIKIAADKALSADGSSTKALSELASQWTNHPCF
ncbi:hydroquinone glucosyltransferase-like [Quercus robur]|uniref:hydroquinone glucosyltransferase-like n=1 Tax=Quercus robur TaxID=38942 RepID=UPI0021619D4A|nr:hydroquinone glucosyltransferase-like [Quercus robur]